MPYDWVDVDCNIPLCVHYDDGECTCEEEADQLNPNTTDCSYFVFRHGPFCARLKDQEEIAEFLGLLEEENVPYVCLDPDSTEFRGIKAGDINAVVRGSKSVIEEFDFYPTVDNKVGYTHKSQLKLEL